MYCTPLHYTALSFSPPAVLHLASGDLLAASLDCCLARGMARGEEGDLVARGEE